METKTGEIISLVIYSRSKPDLTELKLKISGLEYCPGRLREGVLVTDAKN